MLIKKEQYREFDSKKPIWFERPDHLAEPEAGKDKKDETEKPKDKKEATKDLTPQIAKHFKEIEGFLNKVVYVTPEPEGEKKINPKAAMRKMADKLKAHALARFNQISKEYKAQREALGTVEFIESGRGQQLEEEARQVLIGIKDRLNLGYRKYADHQARQDRIDEVRREAKTPQEKKEAKAEIQKVKEEIIVDYLNQAESTKEMDPKMQAMLARFIVKGNLVQLEYGDVDAKVYEGNIHAFFRNVDRFHERIGSKLEGKLEKVVQKFLAEAPNPEADPKEIAKIEEWIQENKGLKLKFGEKTTPDSFLRKASTTLAKRFDIRFNKKGEVHYATDLTARPKVITYDAEGFKNRVILELTGPNFSSSAKLEGYAKDVEKDTEWLKKVRKTIDVGDTFLDIGEIDSWDDWAGHEDAEYLMKINDQIQRRVTQIDKTQDQKDVKERIEGQKNANLDAYYDVAEAADLKGAVSRALGINNYHLVEDEQHPSGEGPYEGYQVIENRTENVKIKVHLNESGLITVAVNPIDANKPGESYFNSVRTFTSKKFKGTDLADLAKSTKESWVKNNKEMKRVQDAILKVDVKGLGIKFQPNETNQRFNTDFKANNPTLLIDGHQVGTLIFHPKTEKGVEEVTIRIDGKDKKVPLKNLKNSLLAQMPTMKKVAERAEKNKGEIEKQLESDWKKLKPAEGLVLNIEKPPVGDFSNPKELIRIATLNKKDKSEAASLYITAGATPAKKGEKAKTRPYVLKIGNKESAFKTMDEVNAFVAKNQEALAKVPEKPKPVTLKKGREKAKANLSKMVMNLWGEKMAGIKPKDVEFSNALNTFLNGLTLQRVTQLGKPRARLQNRERADLLKAFQESYYGNLEGVDENEVKAISGMPVTIKGKPAGNFTEVFGEDLTKTLSMSHQFRAGKKGGVEVKKGEGFVPVDAKGMREYVPARLRADYDKVLNGEDPKAFQEKASDELRAREAMEEIGKAMGDPKKVEAFKKMGLGELIGSLAQLWQMLQEAMRTGDWKTLEDGISDLNKGRNPAERVKSAKEAYANKIGKIEKTGTLLALYNEPYGAKAKELFGAGKESTPYRIQLKQAIEGRLEKELGIDITKMEAKSPAETTITCTKGKDTYRIYLEQSGSQTFATMDKVLIADNGNEKTEPTSVVKTEVKNLTSKDKNMASVLFNEVRQSAKKSSNLSEKGGEEKIDYDKIIKSEKLRRDEVNSKRPEESKKALKEYKEGKKLLSDEKYKEALPLFLNADKKYPSYKVKYFIALCHENMGNKEEALKNYRQFVNTAQNPKEKFKERINEARKRIKELETNKDKKS